MSVTIMLQLIEKSGINLTSIQKKYFIKDLTIIFDKEVLMTVKTL